MGQDQSSHRRIPWVGIMVVLAIILLVVAFGVFKRKGARKPPPIPEQDAATMMLQPTHI